MRARLLLLGEPRLTAGPSPHANPITLPDLVWALLAYLVLHPDQPVDRRRLAFLLWPDATETIAMRNLRQHLHRLRQVFAALELPAERLISAGKQLHFMPPTGLWVDVYAFEQQIQDAHHQIEALELYRGPLLATHSCDWLLPFRSRLRDQYLDALRKQVNIATMQRNYPRALHYANRLLEATPLRESSHRIYMETLYYDKKRAQALQHYKKLERLLERELNAAPMPQTVALYQQIKQGTLPEEMPLPAARPRRLKNLAHTDQTVVGRRKIFSALDEALVQTLNGRGRFILVAGEVGQGKTTLLDAWQAGRQAQLLCLRGMCKQGDSPAAPMLRALRQMDASQRPMTPDWLAAEEAQAEPSIEAVRQFMQMLLAHLKRPMALLMDDLHRADEALWQMLGFWARRCDAHPLLLIGTYRPDALSDSVAHLMHSLQRHHQLEVLRLRSLTVSEVETLVARQFEHLASDARLASRLHGATEGNPFLVTEALTAATPTEPAPTVIAAIEARLKRLTPVARQLLSLVATLGYMFNYRVLVKAAAMEEETVLDALEAWIRLGLIKEQEEGYRFTYRQFRQIIYQQMPAEARRDAHQAIAETLVSCTLAPSLRPSARLAHHYLHSNTPRKALPYLLAAAEDALAMDAYQKAAAWLTQGRAIVEKLSLSEAYRAQVAGLPESLSERAALHRAYELLTEIDTAAVDEIGQAA